MKLQIKRGLPGTGKTTEARKAVEESGNAGRINRDDLRAMLFNSVWTGRREQVVVDCEKAIANVLFQHGLSAIIDDTNLSPGHVEIWKAVAKSVGFNGVQVDILKADIAVAVEQDSQREKPIGKAIIHRMALNAGLIDLGDKPIVIVDVDGTIACGKHREKHVSGECLTCGGTGKFFLVSTGYFDCLRCAGTGKVKKDWKTYYSKLSLDAPIEFVIKMVRALHGDHTICIVSGRPDTYQFQTMDWLYDHEVPYDYIFMRPGGNSRPDTEIKKAILDRMPKEQVLAVLDDRPSVLEMWREQGLRNVIPVRGAIEPF